MKQKLLVLGVLMIGLPILTACSCLSEADREFLNETRKQTEQAKLEAAASAGEAKAASERADKIFQQTQNK